MGDAGAFRDLMLAYYNAGLRFGYTLTRSRQTAEDLVQDVFERIWEQRNGLDPDKSIKTYILTSVRNRALNYLKHESAIARLETRVAQEIETACDEYTFASPEDEFFDRIARSAEATAVAALVQAIAELPERRRTVLALRFDQDLTFRAIGEIVGISDKAAQQLVIRTITDLRKKLLTVVLLGQSCITGMKPQPHRPSRLTRIEFERLLGSSLSKEARSALSVWYDVHAEECDALRVLQRALVDSFAVRDASPLEIIQRADAILDRVAGRLGQDAATIESNGITTLQQKLTRAGWRRSGSFVSRTLSQMVWPTVAVLVVGVIVTVLGWNAGGAAHRSPCSAFNVDLHHGEWTTSHHYVAGRQHGHAERGESAGGSSRLYRW